MKISCAYCGRIHERSYDCGRRPKRIKRKYEKDTFRSTYAWQRKAEEIKERDKYLCQICIRNLYDTKSRINSINLSVHHAIPLKENYDKRLDNDNLLTVCGKHHEMAEKGIIPRQVVLKIIEEQEGNIPPE